MYTMSEDIEFDPVKARANFAKHGVSFAHAEQALRDEFAVTILDPVHHDEQPFLTVGMDEIGRLLVVCHMHRGEQTRLISARKAGPNEVRSYHE